MQDRGPTVRAVVIAFLCVSTLFTLLRLISRFGIVKRVSKDDYAIILAWLIAFGFSFSICYGTGVGLGRHEADVEGDDHMSLRKAEYAFSVLYNPTLMATKTSICLFYLTLSKNHPVFRWTTIATLIVVNVAGLALTLLNIFQCHPVGAAFDDPTQSGAKCIDIVTLYLSSAPVNIITDLAILFLPMPILTSMRLPRNEKIILIITFSFGAFVAVVDVVRIAYLESAALARLTDNGGSAASNAEYDYSWIASLSFMWSAIEVHVGIVVACVPGVKPLAAKLFPTLLGRIKQAKELNGNHFYGPGDAQWANVAPRSRTTSACIPPSPHAPANTARLPTVIDNEAEVGMMDFLTTPDMTHLPPRPPSAGLTTMATTVSTRPRTPSLTIFDFVNVKDHKNMTKLTNRESIAPLALVTILFFLWGFAYGLLDVLNSQFQLIVGSTNGQAVGLHSAYYGAYFFAPLTFGRYIFKKWGFRATFIVGLCIYGCGTLVFWPSAVLASFPAFLISNFIIGLGVATLETAGNPFIALCGPAEYAEVRLNISQGVQAIGSVLSPILAKKVLFKNVLDAPSLIDVQWTYLGIALFDVCLALIFFYLPLPEASDDEMEGMAERRGSVYRRKVLGMPVIFVTLAAGIFSQFCYTGGQESVAGAFQNYVATVRPNSDIGPFNYQAVGHTVFAVGRFLTALAGLVIKPRRILLFLFVGSIISSALAMSLDGYKGVAMIVLILFFESGIFSLIYAISIRGLGMHTKTGAVFITAATSGGAVIPAIMNPVTERYGLQYSLCVVVAVFSFGTLMPIYLCISPAAKKQVDPVHVNRSCILSQETRPMSSSRASRVFSAVTRRKKPPSENTATSDEPTIEHLEARGSHSAEWPRRGDGT
ncbi:MFS transporter, FHS family, L-fucose permease, partial [Lecanoromycetidae sp. Uapishka_2]